MTSAKKEKFFLTLVSAEIDGEKFDTLSLLVKSIFTFGFLQILRIFEGRRLLRGRENTLYFFNMQNVRHMSFVCLIRRTPVKKLFEYIYSD
jgi:hypothetical protein